jgi:hypothetical protein
MVINKTIIVEKIIIAKKIVLLVAKQKIVVKNAHYNILMKEIMIAGKVIIVQNLVI